jgi:hypothetical protein
MKSNFTFFLLLLVLLSFFSCSNKEQERDEVLCRINNFKLYCDEFQEQLAQDVNSYEGLKSTEEVRRTFLKELIEEELLIQEAKKLELDRKKKFVRAIERYWKSTLIRDLLEKKGEEIDKTITVSQTEMEVYYNKIKEDNRNVPPLSEIQDKIAEKLKESKKREELRKWVAGLQKKADIDINQDLLIKNSDGD